NPLRRGGGHGVGTGDPGEVSPPGAGSVGVGAGGGAAGTAGAGGAVGAGACANCGLRNTVRRSEWIGPSAGSGSDRGVSGTSSMMLVRNVAFATSSVWTKSPSDWIGNRRRNPVRHSLNALFTSA